MQKLYATRCWWPTELHRRCSLGDKLLPRKQLSNTCWVIKPWMAALESSGASTMPSVKQIRNKLYNDGKAIENFVFDVALRSLDRIASQKEVYGTIIPAEINTNVAPTAFSPGDRQILQDFNNYKAIRKNRWPLQPIGFTQFRTQPILNRLRLYCSSVVQHKSVKTNNARRYKCKLCFVSATFIPQTSPYKGRSVGRTSSFLLRAAQRKIEIVSRTLAQSGKLGEWRRWCIAKKRKCNESETIS